jgi:imidazole glycerol-phosphate synthase subunit HisH
MSLTVIDYKSGGNLFSLLNSLDAVGASYKVSSEPDEIKLASKIIFPGVGSFNAAMQKLIDMRLDDAIRARIDESCPFLGICVGMQVLFTEGEESSDQTIKSMGLGAIPGSVNKLVKKDGFKIPHMGWNQVKISSAQNPLFKDIKDETDFYFVHSYAYNLNANKEILQKFHKAEFSTTSHSEEFLSSFWDGENLFSTQFHPEKSSHQGLQILKNFIEL